LRAGKILIRKEIFTSNMLSMYSLAADTHPTTTNLSDAQGAVVGWIIKRYSWDGDWDSK
jgi:hypothetical protein